MEHYTHKMRFSDSSFFDFICEYCGRVDAHPGLRYPCPYTNTSTITRRIKALMDKIKETRESQA